MHAVRAVACKPGCARQEAPRKPVRAIDTGNGPRDRQVATQRTSEDPMAGYVRYVPVTSAGFDRAAQVPSARGPDEPPRDSGVLSGQGWVPRSERLVVALSPCPVPSPGSAGRAGDLRRHRGHTPAPRCGRGALLSEHIQRPAPAVPRRAHPTQSDGPQLIIAPLGPGQRDP